MSQNGYTGAQDANSPLGQYETNSTDWQNLENNSMKMSGSAALQKGTAAAQNSPLFGGIPNQQKQQPIQQQPTG